MRAFFVVEKPTRGYFSFHCSRLATQARHACLFCCRETHAWVLQFPLFPFGYTSTPCVPFLLSRNTRVGTYHLHGNTGNSGLKIKWFPPLCLGSFRNYGLWFEAMQFFYSFQSVQLNWLFLVAGHSPTRSNFIVLCLRTRYPARLKKW